MSTELVALRYMTRFRCTAERCEDTCCSGLKVPLSEAVFRRMEATLTAPDERERLARFVAPSPSPTPGEHAHIVPGTDQRCPFFDADRLCSLQRRYGEPILSDACSLFPRSVGRVGERLELTGSLACPEVARLCLLEEAAVEPVAASAELLPREHVARWTEADPYSGHLERVRGAVLQLLSWRQYPLASRLVGLAHLAYALQPFFFRGTPHFGPGGDGEERLEEILGAFPSPEALEPLHQNFAALTLPTGVCVGLFLSAIRARLAAGHGERFAAFARGILETYAPAEGNPEALQGLFAEGCQRLDERFGPRVELYFHNYCVHHAYRTWYTELPSLLPYVFQMVARTALLRVALTGSAGVRTVLAQPDATSEDLDRAAVEVFQISAKNLEQGESMAALLQHALSGESADVLGKLLLFARLT
jgi:lysine-N-methylase